MKLLERILKKKTPLSDEMGRVAEPVKQGPEVNYPALFRNRAENFLETLDKAGVNAQLKDIYQDEGRYDPRPEMRHSLIISFQRPFSPHDSDIIRIKMTESGEIEIRASMPLINENQLQQYIEKTTDAEQIEIAKVLIKDAKDDWNRKHQTHGLWLRGENAELKLDNALDILKITKDGNSKGKARDLTSFQCVNHHLKVQKLT